MAVSRVTVNRGAITSFFQASPTGGTAFGAKHGFSQGNAETLAALMAVAARVNAATFEQRTGALISSVRPIVRHTAHGTEVGVGTTVEHGKWLEIGTDYHFIFPRNRRGFLQDNPSGPKGEVPEKWALEGRHRILPHPGNRATHWLSDAVRHVVPGVRVIVRTRNK